MSSVVVNLSVVDAVSKLYKILKANGFLAETGVEGVGEGRVGVFTGLTVPFSMFSDSVAVSPAEKLLITD